MKRHGMVLILTGLTVFAVCALIAATHYLKPKADGHKSLTLKVVAEQPDPAVLPTDQKISFVAVPEGNLSGKCQWYKDGVPIPGATGSTYTIDQTALSDSGKYTVTEGKKKQSVASEEWQLIVKQ